MSQSDGERWAQIQMAQLRTTQLRVEAEGCHDRDRLAAINAEMRVIYDGLVEIRQQQIMERLERDTPASGSRRARIPTRSHSSGSGG